MKGESWNDVDIGSEEGYLFQIILFRKRPWICLYGEEGFVLVIELDGLDRLSSG